MNVRASNSHFFDTCIKISIFRRVRKIAKSDYSFRRVSPSGRMEQLCCHWTVRDVGYSSIFRKSLQKIEVSLNIGQE
jgi:hypothetical protein